MPIRVRVRIVPPAPEELRAVGISLGVHAVVVVAVIVAGLSAAPPPSGPTITVQLAPAAGRPASRPSSPSAHRQGPVTERPAAKPEARRDEPKPKPPTDEPPPKPKVRQRIDEVSPSEDLGHDTVARPEKLPEAEPQPEDGSDPGTETGDGAGGGASNLPTGPIAGGIAGLATDQPFTADWFLQLVVARLQDAWRDRPLLPAGSQPQRVVIAFTILKDGSVVEERIDSPSRYPPLDLSALRAVDSLERLPPLPRNYGDDRLDARFVFELRSAAR